MKHVWILTSICAAFGLVNGLFLTATPQVCLVLHFGSQTLGLIGAGVPVGYALGCTACGRLFAGVPSKSVLRGGALAALLALAGMSQARTPAACVIAQVCFGMAAGAFWPFASAWMLDFQALGIPKIRLLRHYNVAWTTGMAVGMFGAGQACARGWIFETLYAGAALAALVFLGACVPPVPRPAARLDGAPAPRRGGRGVTLTLLLAAVLANLTALGTRGIIVNNYAELNQTLGFAASRMGILTASIILSQLVGFSLGGLYERWMGLRRTYLCIAGGLILVNLTLAFSTRMTMLLPVLCLHGLLLAAAFQSSMLAAIEYFAVPRSGTTFHESMVGLAGVTSLAGGAAVTAAKAGGADTLNALRAPFLCMAGVIVLVFIAQLILLSTQRRRRTLLAPHMPAVKP